MATRLQKLVLSCSKGVGGGCKFTEAYIKMFGTTLFIASLKVVT